MPTKEEKFEKARRKVRHLVKDNAKMDPLELCLGIADAIAGAVDNSNNVSGLVSWSGVSGMAALWKSGKDADEEKKVLPNIYFTYNELDDTDSPATEAYFTGRSLKGIGGAAFNLVGVAASGSTGGLNVASIVQHGNATGSTLMHLTQLAAIAANGRFKDSKTIHDWLKMCILVKTMKATVRGASTVGACIPAAGLATGIATAIAKTGIKMTMSKVIYATAAAIHWRAYQEQKLSGAMGGGHGGKVGPASMIFWEIFTKRNLTRLFGKYPIMQFVQEPAGWLALADKLMLI